MKYSKILPTAHCRLVIGYSNCVEWVNAQESQVYPRRSPALIPKEYIWKYLKMKVFETPANPQKLVHSLTCEKQNSEMCDNMLSSSRGMNTQWRAALVWESILTIKFDFLLINIYSIQLLFVLFMCSEIRENVNSLIQIIGN